jgi:hypothetical protein
MAYQPQRFAQLRWLQLITCVFALLSGGALIALGLMADDGAKAVWLLAAGAFGLFLGIMWMTLTPVLLKMESTLARQLNELRDLSEAVARQSERLDAIAENTQISDAAKSLARRTQEIEALRNAIREDIRNEQWEAALSLADEIERRFGYKQEATRIREELDDARREAIQTKLSQAIELIEGHFRTHEWARAQKEIERLKNALPDDARVLSLQDRMKLLQEQHKQALKAEWQEAVRRHDTDHAIDVLKELDQYLSPAEAQSLQDSARNVFKEKLLQLGVQFRFAVTEKRWQDALNIGLEIIRDFPNSRMATEVREVKDTLRERARGTGEERPIESARAASAG